MVCKAIELLVTCKLVISGLNFRCHFRYDQEGNVLLQSAVIHLDGAVFSGVISWIYLRSFTCHCHFLSQQIVTTNLVPLSPNIMEFFRLLAHEIAAYKRIKEDYEINGIRCGKVCSRLAVENQP